MSAHSDSIPAQFGSTPNRRRLLSSALALVALLAGCVAAGPEGSQYQSSKLLKVASASESSGKSKQSAAWRTSTYSSPAWSDAAESRAASAVARPNFEAAGQSASGFYVLGGAFDFNVLDAAFFDPASGQVSLVGHKDARYGTKPIPYLEHLAALLEHAEPEFTLNWTPESEIRVAELFRNFNSESYVRSLVAGWTNIMDENGHPTGSGRWLLPLLGVKPTYHGTRLGRLGVNYVETQGKLQITEVVPGMAASRAGIVVGDIIHNYENANELTHSIRLTGEGGKLMLQIRHNGTVGSPLFVILDGAEGDPWAELDRFDVVQRMMNAAGKDKAAMLLSCYASLQRIMGGSRAGFMTAFNVLIAVAGDNDAYWQDVAEFNAGRMSQDQVLGRAFRAILGAMDDAFEYADRPLTARFDAARANGMDSGSAFDAAVPVMNGRIRGFLEEIMHSLLARHDEIQIPPEVMAEVLGPQVVVAPEYRDVDPRSSIARLLFAADYLGKSLINRPDLQTRIPAYLSDFAFERNHPDRVGGWHDDADYHLWLSVAGLDLAESADGHTLHTRGASIRFNIRAKAPTGGDLPPVSGGYEELLTSLYDDFCREYPDLHEFREAAKLAGVAAWLREKEPGLQLPQAGRTSWNGPTVAPGFVFLTFSPQNRPGRLAVALSAMGGAKLAADRAARAQRDARATTFDSTTLVRAPWREDPTAVAALLRVPATSLPKPLGWVNEATLDGHDVSAVSFVPRELRDAPGQVRLQRRADDSSFILWKTGDIDGAVQSFREQLQRATVPSEIARLKLTLADVLRKNGQEQEAIQLLQEARQIDPRNPVLHLLMAEASAETGDKPGAITALKAYLELDPSNAPAIRLLAELEGRVPPSAVPAAAPSSPSAVQDVATIAAVLPRPSVAGAIRFGPAFQQAKSASIDGGAATAVGSESATAVGSGFDVRQQHAPDVPTFQTHPLPRLQVPEQLRTTENWKALEVMRDTLAQQQAEVKRQLDQVHEEQAQPGANPTALAQKERELIEQQKVVNADAANLEKQMRDDIIQWEAENEPAKPAEASGAAVPSAAQPDAPEPKVKR